MDFPTKLIPTAELDFTYIPCCSSCGSSNPKALSRCPVCNSPAPGVQRRHIEAAITTGIPVLGRICLWMGNKLREVASRMQNGTGSNK